MPTQITVAGGNLFQIAAQQLGDATQWIRIAQANGLSDPQLSGVVTLTIPDPDPTAGGGIANQ
jgi:nucleoid-associated protein YgaU